MRRYVTGAVFALAPLAVQMATFSARSGPSADNTSYLYTNSPNKFFCWLNNDCFA